MGSTAGQLNIVKEHKEAISSREWDALLAIEALAMTCTDGFSEKQRQRASTPNGFERCMVMYMPDFGAYRIAVWFR